jgi:glycosyltransferase involved in cell wall biosynthesis
MSSQFGSAAVDIVGVLDDILDWAGRCVGEIGIDAYSVDALNDDLAKLVSQSVARQGWQLSDGHNRLDITLIDGSVPGGEGATVASVAALTRLHVFFAFAEAGDMAGDELLAGYSQLSKLHVLGATCVASAEGNAQALAVITSSEPTGDGLAAWWDFVDAFNTFGSFKFAHLSRLNRRLGDALKHSAVLTDEMLDEVTMHNTARFRERHSLKEISRNLRHEIVHHRLRRGERSGVITKESYFRAASGRLLKEAGSLVGKPRSDGSLLQALALSAVRSRCALYINEDHTFGGLEQWVCDFARHLRSKNYVPYLVVRGTPTLNSRVGEEFPGEVLYLGGDDQALEEVVRQCRFEALVTNHVYGGLEHVPAGCRVVEVLHNIYFWQVDDAEVAEARKRVNCFVAVSGEVARYSSESLRLPQEKLRTVPHGLNVVDLYRPQVAYLEKVRRDVTEFRVLFVGNLYPQKNVVCLIEAFALLRAKVPEARLRLAGAPAESGYVAKVISTVDKLGLTEAVDFLGSLDRHQLSREYAHAHMFVFPSLYEGYGLVNLEAAYFGLPMVLSNTGYAQELSERSPVCRIAKIAMSHTQLGKHTVVERSMAPPNEAVSELYKQMEAVYADYPTLMHKGIRMIENPPFSLVDEAGESMRKLLLQSE